jgi:prevent-host-death family protein
MTTPSIEELKARVSKILKQGPPKTTTVSVRELKARASEILRQIEATGEEVTITRHGKPWAKLVPLKESPRKKRSLRELRGALTFLPDLEYEDFLEVKKIWEPRPLPPEDEE